MSDREPEECGDSTSVSPKQYAFVDPSVPPTCHKEPPGPKSCLYQNGDGVHCFAADGEYVCIDTWCMQCVDGTWKNTNKSCLPNQEGSPCNPFIEGGCCGGDPDKACGDSKA
ncbi:MAG: hypothetical protein AB7T19_17820 [Planctomycetota bacterium]